LASAGLRGSGFHSPDGNAAKNRFDIGFVDEKLYGGMTSSSRI